MDSKNNVRFSIAAARDNNPTRDAYTTQRSRLQTLKSCIVHILPVGVTFGILQLSFRHVYWADSDAANMNVKLAALQVAAKVHEILIMLSLSTMVLHYARKLMVPPQGMSLGLLVATYQSVLSGHPWTVGSWETLKQLFKQLFKRKSREKTEIAEHWVRPWHLAVLLALSAFIAMFVGPASAITIIPQLDWWHREDLMGNYQQNKLSFSVYVPTKLFPSEVDSSRLPGSFCDDVANDVNSTCPSAGATEVQNTFALFDANKTDDYQQNVTISPSGSDFITRRMLYMQAYQPSMAAVSVPNYLLETFASLLKLPADDNLDESYDGDGTAFILDMFTNGVAPLSPLVGADCSVDATSTLVRNYSYEINSLVNGEYRQNTSSLDINLVWSEDDLASPVNGTDLRWRDVTNVTGTPVLLGLLRHQDNLTVCSVQSYWTSTSQWVSSTSNYDVITNFTWGSNSDSMLKGKFGYPSIMNELSIHIHEEWAETLNAVNGSTKVLEAVLQFGMTQLQKADTNYPSSNAALGADERFPMSIAQLIAKSVANGLSLIGAEYAADQFLCNLSLNDIIICNDATKWCSKGPWLATNDEMPLGTFTNVTREAVPFPHFDCGPTFTNWTTDSSPFMHSFAKPVDADENWTRLEFPVLRYGRGYAFNGISIYLAAALLCFHATITVLHVAHRLAFDFQTFDFGGSLSSLLILAMGDNAPLVTNMWTSTVALIPFTDTMEIPFTDTVERERLKFVVVEAGVHEAMSQKDPDELMTDMDYASTHELQDFRHRGRYPGKSFKIPMFGKSTSNWN